MLKHRILNRRSLLLVAAAGATLTAAEKSLLTPAFAAGSGSARALAPLRQIKAGVLNVSFYEAGPSDGQPVILLHGFPYDIHSYADVAPSLAATGYRVIVPHLRGHGATTFLEPTTPRSGQQAAIGQELVDLLDALGIRKAIFAGYDWGGRAACVAAALWPERCAGLVSVNGYLIQDIERSGQPAPAKVERGFWYQFYFQTERGRSGLAAHRNDIAKIMWQDNSPTWHFDDETFLRSARSFDNPDYVPVVIHSYRHRLGGAEGYSHYEGLERILSKQPLISVPSITLDGDSDGVVAATDGSASASKFSGKRTHRIIKGAGHNLPQEAPDEFVNAVIEVTQL